MGKWLVLVTIALIAPSAAAQTLYRCPGQGTNGATLIQDKPCPDGREAATVLDSREIHVSPRRQRQIAAERARHDQALQRSRRSSGWSSGQRRPTEAQRRRQACEDAKTWRDTQRRRLSLNRTYEQLSALDRHVRLACKDVGP